MVALCDDDQVEQLQQKQYGLQELTYLLSTLLQKTFGDPYSRAVVLKAWSINITWELVRNAESQVTPRSTETETLGVGPINLCCNEPTSPQVILMPIQA